MSYTVVVFEKGAVDDVDALRDSVGGMAHGCPVDPIVHNHGYTVRISKFKNPPLAVYAKGAVEDDKALRRELERGIALVEINPGFSIEFVER